MSLESILQEALTCGELRVEDYARIHWPRYLETWATVKRYVSPPAKTLEVGALFGHISMGLSLMGYEVRAVDIREEVKRYGPNLLRYGIPDYVCDIGSTTLLFPDETFDLIVFTEVLEHINPLATQRAILEISRVLKKGGYLVVSTPNAFNLGARIRMLLGRKYLCLEHIREYSLPEVLEILQGKNIFTQSGGIAYLEPKYETHLEVVEAKYTLVIDRLKVGSKRIRLARKLMMPFKAIYPSLRSSIFIVARKI